MLQLPAVLQLQPQLVMLLQLASQLQLAAVDQQSEKDFSLVFMLVRAPAVQLLPLVNQHQHQLANQLQLPAVAKLSEKVFSLVFMHARSPAALQQQVHVMQLLLVQLLLLAMQLQLHVQLQLQHLVQHQQLAAAMQLQPLQAAAMQLQRLLVQRFSLASWLSARPVALRARLQQPHQAAVTQLLLLQLQAAVATKEIHSEQCSLRRIDKPQAVIVRTTAFFSPAMSLGNCPLLRLRHHSAI